MKTDLRYDVTCYMCNASFNRHGNEIRVDLDEVCEWDGDTIVDCWWTHDYYAICPSCKEEVAVTIVSQHSCCLD